MLWAKITNSLNGTVGLSENGGNAMTTEEDTFRELRRVPYKVVMDQLWDLTDFLKADEYNTWLEVRGWTSKELTIEADSRNDFIDLND